MPNKDCWFPMISFLKEFNGVYVRALALTSKALHGTICRLSKDFVLFFVENWTNTL